MILPDINLVVYAYNADAPFHASAKAWWEGCLSGTVPVGHWPGWWCWAS